MSSLDPNVIFDMIASQVPADLHDNVLVIGSLAAAYHYRTRIGAVAINTKDADVVTHLLEPGPGYTGGESFFEAAMVEEEQAPLVYVDADESAKMGDAEEAPEGLRRAICFFVVAAAVQVATDRESAAAGQNFLCHTSQLNDQHSNLAKLMRDYIDYLDDEFQNPKSEVHTALHEAHENLRRTMPDVPTLSSLMEIIQNRVGNRSVVVINAKGRSETGRGLNFIVGGNILGRGVTIENLLVTYYLREPKTGQMDTMLQHARMYGYRSSLMHLTRVYLPKGLAVRFHEIHMIEQRLRRQLVDVRMDRQIVIEKAANLYPTRRGVLDAEVVEAFDPQDQVYPHYPKFNMKRAEYDSVSARLRCLLGEDLDNDVQEADISFDDLLALVDDFPYDAAKDSGSWNPPVIRRVLEQQRKRCANGAKLYVRRMNRRRDVLTTGALSGSALEELRSRDVPTFCAFRDDGRGIPTPPGASDFWYPTVVFDAGMPSVILNLTPDV